MMIKYNSESYDLTNELIQKSAIDGFVSSFDDYVSVDTKVSTIGEVPGVIHSFELSLNSIPATGKFAIFSDGENGSCGIMYVSKKDTKTDYANDFDSMISSVVPETSAE